MAGNPSFDEPGPGEYRYAAARFIKLLIRARAKVEPNFLCDHEYRRWELSRIRDDRGSVEHLLLMAAAAYDDLWRQFIGPNGSGGVAVDDPLGELKERIVQFCFTSPPSELLNQIRTGQTIDWPRTASWGTLSAIRDGLDALPHPAEGTAASHPECPVEMGACEERVAFVNGVRKRLTRGRYNVIQTLVNAFPATLTKDELIRLSGHSDAVNMLKALANGDADWRTVIRIAGSTGGGYGLNP
jgi:hypothetical protein